MMFTPGGREIMFVTGCYVAQETEFSYKCFFKALKQCPLKIWLTYAVILCIPKMSWIFITF